MSSSPSKQRKKQTKKSSEESVESPSSAESPIALVTSSFGDERGAQLIEEYLKLLRGDQFNESTLTLLVVRTIRFVEQLSRQAPSDNDDFRIGSFKKQLAIRLLQYAVESNEKLDLEAKEALLLLIETMVPTLIDTLIEVDHKRLFKNVGGFFSRMCGCNGGK